MAPADFVSVLIVMVFTAEHTRNAMAHIAAIGIPMVGAAKEAGCAASNFMTFRVIVVYRAEQARSAFADFASSAVIMIGCAKKTRTAADFFLRHNHTTLTHRLHISADQTHNHRQGDIENQT